MPAAGQIRQMMLLVRYSEMITLRGRLFQLNLELKGFVDYTKTVLFIV